MSCPCGMPHTGTATLPWYEVERVNYIAPDRDIRNHDDILEPLTVTIGGAPWGYGVGIIARAEQALRTLNPYRRQKFRYYHTGRYTPMLVTHGEPEWHDRVAVIAPRLVDAVNEPYERYRLDQKAGAVDILHIMAIQEFPVHMVRRGEEE